jgi:hypothetical protein
MTRLLRIVLLALAASVAAPPLFADEPAGPEPDLSLDVDVEQILLDLDRAPAVEQVQAWAVGEAMVSPARAARLLRDARTRGALPLIRLRGRYEDGSNRKWDDLDLLDSRNRDMDYTVDLWLEWDLAELAASTDTYRAAREARALTELRQAVQTQVTIAYFDRKRLLAEGYLAPLQEEPERAIVRRLRVEELDATLDALTGGRWTATLAPTPRRRTSRRPTESPSKTLAPREPE